MQQAKLIKRQNVQASATHQSAKKKTVRLPEIAQRAKAIVDSRPTTQDEARKGFAALFSGESK